MSGEVKEFLLFVGIMCLVLLGVPTIVIGFPVGINWAIHRSDDVLPAPDPDYRVELRDLSKSSWIMAFEVHDKQTDVCYLAIKHSGGLVSLGVVPCSPEQVEVSP